jgi:hypothetical protein
LCNGRVQKGVTGVGGESKLSRWQRQGVELLSPPLHFFTLLVMGMCMLAAFGQTGAGDTHKHTQTHTHTLSRAHVLAHTHYGCEKLLFPPPPDTMLPKMLGEALEMDMQQRLTAQVQVLKSQLSIELTMYGVGTRMVSHS